MQIFLGIRKWYILLVICGASGLNLMYANNYILICLHVAKVGVILILQALRDRKRLVTIYWLNDILAKGKLVPPYEIIHLPSTFTSTISLSFIRSQVGRESLIFNLYNGSRSMYKFFYHLYLSSCLICILLIIRLGRKDSIFYFFIVSFNLKR